MINKTVDFTVCFNAEPIFHIRSCPFRYEHSSVSAYLGDIIRWVGKIEFLRLWKGKSYATHSLTSSWLAEKIFWSKSQLLMLYAKNVAQQSQSHTCVCTALCLERLKSLAEMLHIFLMHVMLFMMNCNCSTTATSSSSHLSLSLSALVEWNRFLSSTFSLATSCMRHAKCRMKFLDEIQSGEVMLCLK